MNKFFRSFLTATTVAALCLSIAVVPLSGCNAQADTTKAVQLIQAELPTAISLVPVVIQLVDAFGVSANGSAGVGTTIQSDLQELQDLTAPYLAAPSADGFNKILAVVDNLVSQGDAGLLAAAQIKDPATQQKATAAISALDLVLHVIDGYIQAVSTPAQTKASVARRTIHVSQVAPYWNHDQVMKSFSQPAVVEIYPGARLVPSPRLREDAWLDYEARAGY